MSGNINIAPCNDGVIQMISCKMYNDIFSYVSCFEKHMDWHKNAPAIIIDIMPKKDEPKTKKFFLEPRKDISRLKEHIKVIPEPRNSAKFKCTHCFMFCKSYPGLNRHMVMIYNKSTENLH